MQSLLIVCLITSSRLAPDYELAAYRGKIWLSHRGKIWLSLSLCVCVLYLEHRRASRIASMLQRGRSVVMAPAKRRRRDHYSM